MISLGKITTPIARTGKSETFMVYGKSFLEVSAVYLSGNTYDNSTFFNPFSAVAKLSAQNPGFYALKLNPSQYSFNTNRQLTITIPPPTKIGFIDIILQNEAGWGNLSRFVIRNTINPYPDGHPLRSSWEPYEKPWTKGIRVIPLTPLATMRWHDSNVWLDATWWRDEGED